VERAGTNDDERDVGEWDTPPLGSHHVVGGDRGGESGISIMWSLHQIPSMAPLRVLLRQQIDETIKFRP
jgi:hypothetical protein